MKVINKNEFYDYLIKNNIEPSRDIEDNSFEFGINEESLFSHIKTIKDIHERIMGYRGTIGNTLPNNIGKLVENKKLEIKKTKMYINSIKSKKEREAFENYILDYSEVYLKRAEKCIEYVYTWNYMDLILRSMRRNEICIGDSSTYNIAKKQNIIVRDISEFCYDMVEIDMIYCLQKLKRKGINLDWKALIHKFCEVEVLDVNSIYFISALVSYPYETMKFLEKCNDEKIDSNEKKLTKKFMKAIEKDGESLI